MRASLVLPILLIGCASLPQPGSTPAGTEATLALLETTDLHANVLGYDYYKLKADPSIGLERTATLIEQARAEFPNTLLLDNGDALQGTALADYQALVAPVGRRPPGLGPPGRPRPRGGGPVSIACPTAPRQARRAAQRRVRSGSSVRCHRKLS